MEWLKLGNKIQLPIANGFYVSDALPISNQRCVNFYPNVPQADSVTDANLFGTPGTSLLSEVETTGACRGAHEFGGKAYFVIRQELYRLNRTYDADNNEVFGSELLGGIEGVSLVSMADNGDQLCIVAAPDAGTIGKSYIFTESPDSLVQITDGDFDGPALNVVYSDGYFVFAKADSDKFFNSAIKNGLSYDALDFSQAVADPDDIRSTIALKSQLYVLGSQTIEVFRNIARVPSPFQRISGGVLDVGVIARNSVKLFAGQFAFIGSGVNESPSVWMVSGGQKDKISTIAIGNELSKLSDSEISAADAWVYAESGNFFYGVSLPDTTFVYDVVNQRWHERQSTDGLELSRSRICGMIAAYGRIIVGDSQSGKIGELLEGVYTEYNTLVRRFVTTKPFDNQGKALSLAALEAVVESGTGLTANIELMAGINDLGQPVVVTAGLDPQITLSWSDDGGRIFVGDLSRSTGKLGEYKIRPTWRKLGRFPRSRVIKLEVSSPTKATIIKLEAEISG